MAYLGIIREDDATTNAAEGDTAIAFRPAYNRWEAWVREEGPCPIERRVKMQWVYMGQGSQQAMESLALEMSR